METALSTQTNRTSRFWIRAWLPVVIAVLVIAIESTEPFGANHTSRPLRWLWEQVFGYVPTRRWDVIHHYIRKTGHFVGYGLVALTWLRAWWMTLPNSTFVQDAGLAMLGTVLLAAGDEFHQSYLPNRGSSGWDVLLDCCGALVMQALVFLFLRIFRPRKLARAA